MTRYHGQITGTSHMRRHHCFSTLYPDSNSRNSVSKSESSSTPTNEKRISANNRKRKEPYALSTIDDFNINWTNVYEKYSEVKDAISQDFVGYLSCKTCKVIIKKDLQAINGHLCKSKDLDKQAISPTFTSMLLFRMKPKSRATPIWDDFEEVIDPSTNTILGYVRCKRCKDIIKASDPKSIPAVLRRHLPLCTCEYSPSTIILPSSNKQDLKANERLSMSETNDANVNQVNPSTVANSLTSSTPLSSQPKVINAKADFRERVIQFCYSELVNLETVTSESFRKLAQSLMSLGAQYGRSTLVLPDTSQLQSQMHSYYTSLKSQINSDLNLEMSRNLGGALVCDSQDDVCILSAYYINNNWQLVESVLSATTSESDINSFITSTLNEYGLNEEEKLSKFTFVSRGGLFDGVNIFLPSMSHTIDQIIESTLFVDDTYTDIIENCKIICGELEIDIKLNPLVENVDWVYKFEVMNSVLTNRDKFELKNSSLDLELVKCMIDILSPFRDASLELRQCNSHPTLNHVLLWYYKLLKVLSTPCDESVTNFGFVNTLKSMMKMGIEQNFQLHHLHKIAAFLWPNFRYLKMLSPEERDIVHSEVRGFIETRLSNETNLNEIAKKARSDFSDWEDSNDDEQDEVEKYVSAMLTTCNESNLLQWWKEHQSDFPKLSHLAKGILAIPASVTSLERYKLYSTERVDEELLFLHCNA